MEAVGDGALVWNPPAPSEILCWPLPHESFADRLLLKAVALAVRRQVGAIYGLDHLPGAPTLPVGLRFPQADPARRTIGAAHIHIGIPREPPTADTMPAPQSAVREWHATLMTDIARLSGKIWKPRQGELR